MASRVSRTYLNSLSHAQFDLHRSTRSSRIIPVTHRCTYATATALATNKNGLARTTKTNGKTPVSAKASSISGSEASQKPAGRAGTIPTHRDAATKTSPSKSLPPSEEEQIKQLDRILAFSQFMPTADVWGLKVETLDVMIPYPIFSSWNRGILSQFWLNFQNNVKNMAGMSMLATNNAFPGVNTATDGFFKKFFKWPFYSMGTKSTRPTGWLAPTRKLALDTYMQLNIAMARNDLREIKRLATDSFLADTLTSQKKRLPGHSYIWRFHREVNPTQIVSLRVVEGNMSPEEPKFGNRLMVHALVKFDTEQSLEVYDRHGGALHDPAPDATKTKNGLVPAKKQHVVQYLVLEKRMWYDGPWAIRDQIWEVDPKKAL